MKEKAVTAWCLLRVTGMVPAAFFFIGKIFLHFPRFCAGSAVSYAGRGVEGKGMGHQEHEIIRLVSRAQRDQQAADHFIQQYMGFIRSETVKFTHTAPENGHEDELSIAMLAFYESILSYQRGKGPFLPYAARNIKNRLIDHYRREKRHMGVLSLHAPDGEEEARALLDTLPDQTDHWEGYALKEASRQEIREFGQRLEALGLTFGDVADNCPKQERTFAVCRRVLDYARKNPRLLRRLEESGRLPMNELAQGAGAEKKTLERHRKYLVALLLAFTNGYEIIRGHLRQMGPAKGGRGA